MTQDEIIRMATEAGFLRTDISPYELLERFAALVAQNYMAKACGGCVIKQCYKRMDAEIEAAVLKEREACAKVAESIVTKQSKHINDGKPFYDHMYWEDIAAAIRARGESELP